MNLQDTIRELTPRAKTIPLPELRRLVLDLKPSPGEISPYIHFAEERYARNLVHRSPDFEVLVLCWRPGQRSPIHDHADSRCAVYIHEGVMSTDNYRRSPAGHVRPDYSEDGQAGTVFSIQGEEIHQVSNLEDDRDLVSLHFYLAPLENYKVYSLMSASWETYDLGYTHVYSFGGGI